MKVLSSLVQIAEDGSIVKPDVIEYRGGLWFVPEWLVNHEEKWRMPARIVRLDLLQHQRNAGLPDCDIVVNEPVPRSSLFGFAQPPADQRLAVIETPQIRFPLPATH